MNLRGWEQQRLEVVPAPWRKRVFSMFERQMHMAMQIAGGTGKQSDAVRDANVWLMDTTARMAALRVPVNMTDSELCDMAREKARECMNLVVMVPGVYMMDAAHLRERMGQFVEGFGIKQPGKDVLNGPAISRMTDELWWRRALRVAQARSLENEAIRLGYVSRKKEIYASNVTVERRRQQRRRNARNLEQTIAVNLDTGEEYKLAELAEKSVANPRIRHGELMTRISGFEAVAKGLGHVAEFVTLTTPSKYHPTRTGADGKPVKNSKYEGATPREAQSYLTKIWALIRAKLARIGVRPYGFRIAEPHHDGCPHWHMILFCALDAVQVLRDVIRAYALREDGAEAGAYKHRVGFVTIDPRKGSAAGYVAKYVSKNIDGGNYQVQGDLEGGQHDAITPTHRVEAWASTWGIRQFQQIGGAPVGVWRELRRMDQKEDMAEFTKAALAAADAGNWGRYTEVMGGPTVKRKALPLRTAYKEKDKPNRYGEMGGLEICGITENLFDGVTFSRVYESRRYQWEIKRCRNGISNAGFVGGNTGGKSLSALASDVTAQEKLSGYLYNPQTMNVAEGLPAKPVSPWTRVNNCTHQQNQGVKGGESHRSGGQGGKELEGSAIACKGDGFGVHGAGFRGSHGAIGSGSYH